MQKYNKPLLFVIYCHVIHQSVFTEPLEYFLYSSLILINIVVNNLMSFQVKVHISRIGTKARYENG